MTIFETHYALLDTEATRREPDDPENELLEVAIQMWTGNRELVNDHYETLVFPVRPIPPEASGIHHITEGDVIGAPERAQVDLQVDARVAPDAVCVAHHATYDYGVLDVLKNRRWLCTERLAHHLLPDAPNFKLQTLRYYLGVGKLDVGPPHRAMGDVIVLREVFFKLLAAYAFFAKVECKGDEARYDKAMQVDTLIAFAARTYVMKTIPFGKHAGTPFEDVPLDYLQWALSPRGMTDIDLDLRWNIGRALIRGGAL